jgi:hypothetical protein
VYLYVSCRIRGTLSARVVPPGDSQSAQLSYSIVVNLRRYVDSSRILWLGLLQSQERPLHPRRHCGRC